MRDHTTGYVDLDELCCPGCRDHVADGPDGFGHADGSELCDATGEPIEISR